MLLYLLQEYTRFISVELENSTLYQTTKSYTCLTLSETPNFRPFQTERVYRRQFQTCWKWKKVIQTGRKHCGKRRNCSLRAISPFPTVFSKDWYSKHVKTRPCFGKGETQSICRRRSAFDYPREEAFLKTLWEKEKMLVTSIFSFSHIVLFTGQQKIESLCLKPL